MNNSTSYAILSNSTVNGDGQVEALKKAVQDGIKAIGTWPDLDLF
ncbi:MAG: hypothetical protein ACPGQR_03035 [Marinirhabdus sp.]